MTLNRLKKSTTPPPPPELVRIMIYMNILVLYYKCCLQVVHCKIRVMVFSATFNNISVISWQLYYFQHYFKYWQWLNCNTNQLLTWILIIKTFTCVCIYDPKRLSSDHIVNHFANQLYICKTSIRNHKNSFFSESASVFF
jgi:hypothetical protein